MPNDLVFPGQPAARMGVTGLPANRNYELWQGDVQEFIIEMADDTGPIDLTGQTPTALIRPDFDSVAKWHFTCTVLPGSKVKLYMSSATTDTIPAGDYMWSFQLTNTLGDSRTYLAGDVVVYSQVDGDPLVVDE